MRSLHHLLCQIPAFIAGAILLISFNTSLAQEDKNDKPGDRQEIRPANPDFKPLLEPTDQPTLKPDEQLMLDPRVRPVDRRFFLAKQHRVHGVVLADLREMRFTVRGNKGLIQRENPQLGESVLLPDISVFAKNTSTGATTEPVLTDVSGAYDIPFVPEGDYVLCWDASDWQGQCTDKPFTVADGVTYPTPLYLRPTSASRARTIAGRAYREDGSICRFLDVPSAMNTVAVLTTPRGSDDRPRRVRANNQGYFVMPNVTRARTRVTISCPGMDEKNVELFISGKETGNGFTQASQGLEGLLNAGGSSVTVRVPRTNNFEIYEPLSASTLEILDMSAVSQADPNGAILAPNTEIALTLELADPTAVETLWRFPGGTLRAEGNKAAWRTPDRNGKYTIDVFAFTREGNWQYYSKSFNVSEKNAGRMPFSGMVKASDRRSLPDGLDVRVNGQPATVRTTDGYFEALIKPEDRARYTLTISAPGYLTISEVYTQPRNGGRYRMQKLDVQKFTAQEGGTLIFSDKNEKRQTELNLNGNNLVIDGTTGPYQGQVEASLFYYDALEAPLPGDYAARSREGEELELLSYGAVHVDLRTPSGEKLQLANNANARIRIPIPSQRLTSGSNPPPDEIRIWTYNETTGFWDEDAGTARRDGAFYLADVSHFSSINLDRDRNGGTPSCLRVELDFQKTSPTEKKIRITTSSFRNGAISPNTSQSKSLTLDKAINMVYGLDAGAANTPNPVFIELLDTATSPASVVTPAQVNANPGSVNDFDRGFLLQVKSGNSFITAPFNSGSSRYFVNLDNTAATAGGTREPAYPYTACKTTVRITRNLPTPGSGEFLIRKNAAFGSGQQAAAAEKAETYFKLVDPNGDRDTLLKWLNKNGFGATLNSTNDGYTLSASDIFEISYLNSGDLGSGRKMQCRKASGDVACIVGNHTAEFGINFDRDPAAAGAANSQDVGQGFATVAMEYSTVEGAPSSVGRLVKFFAYGSVAAANGGRAPLVVLDGVSGQRQNPNVCQICHGGTVSPNMPATRNDLATLKANNSSAYNALLTHIATTDPSSFREFDYGDRKRAGFAQGLVPGAITDLQPVLTIVTNRNSGHSTDTEEVIKQLNCNFVLASQPVSTIKNTILKWYGASSTNAQQCDTGSGSSTRQAAYTPPTWSSAAALYEKVVEKSCRTCHIALPNSTSNVNFEIKTQFDNSSYAPCLRVMPQAEVAFNKYWSVNDIHDTLKNAYASVGSGSNPC